VNCLENNLIVHTESDGREYRSVVEIVYIDEEGDEVVHERATDVCIGLNTCSDMGQDTYATLQQLVCAQLSAEGIEYETIEVQRE